MKLQETGIILRTEKYRECVRFYGRTLGLSVRSRKRGLTNFRFGRAYLMVEKKGVAKRRPKTSAQNPTILRFNVPDMDRALRDLKKKGLVLQKRVYSWGTIAHGSDPDGNLFELCRWPD